MFPTFKFYVDTNVFIILSLTLLGGTFLTTLCVYFDFLNSCKLDILTNFDIPIAFFKIIGVLWEDYSLVSMQISLWLVGRGLARDRLILRVSCCA